MFSNRAKACALGLLAAAAAAGWLMARRADAAGADTAPAPVLQHLAGQAVVPEGSALRRTLQIQVVADQSVERPFSLPATVEADPARLVKVLPPITGRIVSLDKRLGDTVKAGDVLFRLDAPDLAQAMSDAQKANATLELARRALHRQEDLGSSEIAAQRDIEQAKNDFEQASSEAARTAARLAQLGAGASNAVSGRTLAVRAPIAGHVIELNAATGAYWNDATAALMTVADLSTVFLSASAGEDDLGAVFVGQPVVATLDAYAGQAFTGRVNYVGEVLDPDTRRVKVRVAFDNRDGRLKPGMFARATLLARPHPGLLVPIAAVVQSGFDTRVFVEVQPWRFEPRVVRLGAKVGDSIEIASGLKAGERIVVRDGVLLDD
ncbi:MAG TPA: efflux RND transporter periplasmic adaptor subunit [Burkholderiaceae bacterium]|nr:efflux RND transporter periplasmic adaptor subunit [Burkholderiaceae bacterium]